MKLKNLTPFLHLFFQHHSKNDLCVQQAMPQQDKPVGHREDFRHQSDP